MAEAERGRSAPCKGCPDRYPGCSDHCRKEAFLKWKEAQATIRANRAKDRINESYHVETVRRTKRCR